MTDTAASTGVSLNPPAGGEASAPGAGSGVERERSDAILLKCFVADRDQNAFADLVHRHGPMVMGVCRRVLHHHEDAEDAFQATFLVLATKARSIRKPALLGNWLFGVAVRAAKEARRLARRRRLGEEHLMETLRQKSAGHLRTVDSEDPELRRVLDEEIDRIPQKYRAALVLCCLEGKSRSGVARQLGWPEGTAATRLARARHLLCRRLEHRGFGTSEAALSGALSYGMTAAPVSPALAASTLGAAAMVAAGKSSMAPAAVLYLAKEVSRAMLVAKLKTMVMTAVGSLLAMSVAGAAALWVADSARHRDARNAAEVADQFEERPAVKTVTAPLSVEPGERTPMENWRPSFDAAYRLKEGEVARFVPAPFAPERGEFYRETLRGSTPALALSGQLVLLLAEDGKFKLWSFTAAEGNVWSALSACGVSSWETEGADLLRLPMAGDWVMRESASRDEKVRRCRRSSGGG